jgi:hypothetical protein
MNESAVDANLDVLPDGPSPSTMREAANLCGHLEARMCELRGLVESAAQVDEARAASELILGALAYAGGVAAELYASRR